jgi:predicted nucleotidyltransferase
MMEIVMGMTLVALAAALLVVLYKRFTPPGLPIDVEIEYPTDWDEWERKRDEILDDIDRFFREKEKESKP